MRSYFGIHNHNQVNRIQSVNLRKTRLIPTSKGGKEELSNYQFLTIFENLVKRDMTMEEWNVFKRETNTKSDYFIESILKGGLE